MIRKFRCDCETHLLELDYDKKWKMLTLLMYDIYSETGRKYKKPKLIADVVLMDNRYPKELTKLLKFFDTIKGDK